MWSPGNPVSDENQLSEVQHVHRKSVGRTPLKPISGQQLAVVDPYTLVSKRASLSKPSGHAALTGKESTRVSFGTPVSVWIDPCHSDCLSESSEIEANVPKKLPPCALLEKVVSGESLTLPACRENGVQFHQSRDTSVLSQPMDSFDSLAACSYNTDSHRLPVNEVAHSYKLISLPSSNTTCVLQESQTCPKLEYMLMSVQPENPADAHSVLTSQSPLKHITEPDQILLENIDTKVGNIGLHISKPDIVLPYVRDTGLFEDLMLTGEELDGVEVVSEPDVLSSNVTYEIVPHLDGDLEQTSVPVIDVLSEVTEITENWNLSKRANEDCYKDGLDDDNEGNITSSSHMEMFSSPSPGTVKVDLMETQLLSCSPEVLDLVVSSNSQRSFPDTFRFEDSLLKKLVFHDPAISSCETQNYTSETTANRCCTPSDGMGTDHVLMESDSTLLTNTKWSSPISNMDKVCLSNPSTDEGNVMKNTPFTESCPTPIMPYHSKALEIPSLGKGIFKDITPRVFFSPHEAGTSMTPVSTFEGVTWTTPIMLLNKSMNTSGDFIGKWEKSVKDNASETDSVLWNFSREVLCNASRDELMDRLESALIVVEVLSRQLQSWQQTKVSSKPSEQRECSTQTCVTSTSTEEQYYHNLYLTTLRRLQSMQHNQEQEQTQHQHLKEATEALTSHKNEASSMVEFAKSLHEINQKDRADLQQMMSHCHKLLADGMDILEKTNKKLHENLLQRDEMKARMEKAIQAKEAADQCLQDLEIHSSAVISQLRQGLVSERQLCDSVKEAYEQQRSYNEELTEFVRKAQYVCSEGEADQNQLQKQCSQMKELMSRHYRLFDAMKARTTSALEECEGIKMERDLVVLENEEVHNRLESMKSQHEQMKLENSRLGSELELLMERVCALQLETDQLTEENSELAELLSAKDSSMKLLEKELNEATARGQQHQDRIKQLDSQIYSFEKNLSNARNQKQTLQKQLENLAKEHTSQVLCYTESLEYLEQENSVCREQVQETESQLKAHHHTVLERSYECENLKDAIKELQKEICVLQEKLSHSQEEAQTRIMKLSKEISDSSMEVSKIKSRMLELRDSAKTQAIESLPGSQTPGKSLVLSKDEELTTSINAEDSKDQRKGIWSKTSAFTVVLPVTPQSDDTPQAHLPDVIRELSNIVADFITTSSNAMEEKQQIIQDLKLEISSLREELQSQRFQQTSEMRKLQEELGNLTRRNCVLDKKINCKEKCISELQEVVNQQEQKILQQFIKAKESEVLIQENAELQVSLKVCEKEVEVLKQELAQNSADAARSWIKEKLLLYKDLTTLRLKLVDTEYSKSEAIQRLLRHKDILKANLTLSETEVRKLDEIIVRIRQVLLSIPDVVDNCDKLRGLMEFLN